MILSLFLFSLDGFVVQYMSKLSNDLCYETERREDLESKISMTDYLMTSVMKQKEMMVDNFNRGITFLNFPQFDCSIYFSLCLSVIANS